MSAESRQDSLPSAEAARDALYARVFAPAFFDKLASFGIEPHTEEDAEKLLQMGERLFQFEREQAVKQAAHKSSFLDKAAGQLDQTLMQLGVPVTTSADVRSEKIARSLLDDESLVQAAVALQNAYAARVAAPQS